MLPETYVHFKERLKERYGLEITLKEYNALGRMELDIIGPAEEKRTIGFLFFKGRKIMVIKGKGKSGPLVTALDISIANCTKKIKNKTKKKPKTFELIREYE